VGNVEAKQLIKN